MSVEALVGSAVGQTARVQTRVHGRAGAPRGTPQRFTRVGWGGGWGGSRICGFLSLLKNQGTKRVFRQAEGNGAAGLAQKQGLGCGGWGRDEVTGETAVVKR